MIVDMKFVCDKIVKTFEDDQYNGRIISFIHMYDNRFIYNTSTFRSFKKKGSVEVICPCDTSAEYVMNLLILSMNQEVSLELDFSFCENARKVFIEFTEV